MAHSYTTTKYTERLVLHNGNIYREISAKYKNHKKLLVLRQKVGTDRPMIRNIECCCITGWVFIDPQDKGFRWYSNNNGDTYGIDKWWVCGCSCNLTGEAQQTKEELERLILKSKQKDFIYTFRALAERNYFLNYLGLFNLINMWLKYPNCEYLIKLGYEKLAFSTTLLKMKKKKQQVYINFLLQNKPNQSINFTELQCLMKGIDDYQFFLSCYKSIDIYNYLKKQNETFVFYQDYKRMCERLEKDLNDPYWLYPSNLRERHNFLIEQQEAIKRAKEIETENKIKKIALKLAKKLNKNVNGYEISVASSISDIQEQAKVLSQCLMTCSYYKKYADKKCILVFIKKGNKRLATAEVFYNKKKPLGQFYGNERNRNNCLPNKSIKEAFNNWLNNTYLTSNLCRA